MSANSKGEQSLPGSSGLKKEFQQGPDGVEAVGVVAETGFAPDFEGGVEGFEVGGEDFGVFGGGNDLVIGANHEGDGDPFEFFGEAGGGDLRVGFGFFGGDSVGLEAAGVVAFGGFAIDAAGPGLEVADRVVTVDRSDLVRMAGGEVEDEKAAAGHSFEDGSGAEIELGGEVPVKFIAPRHRFFASVKIGHVHVGEVVSALEKGKVESRLVSEKAGPPDPGVSGSGLFGKDQSGLRFRFRKNEIVAIEVLPFAVRGDLGALTEGRGGEKEDEEEFHGCSEVRGEGGALFLAGLPRRDDLPTW